MKALKVEAETEAAATPADAPNGDAVEEDEVHFWKEFGQLKFE